MTRDPKGRFTSTPKPNYKAQADQFSMEIEALRESRKHGWLAAIILMGICFIEAAVVIWAM